MDPKEEDEPERHVPLRTPPPAKKSLERFLEEFEARLRDHPSLPATTAGQALEERAEGVRRHPVESNPDRLPRFRRRPGAGPARPYQPERRVTAPAPEAAPAGAPQPPVTADVEAPPDAVAPPPPAAKLAEALPQPAVEAAGADAGEADEEDEAADGEAPEGEAAGGGEIAEDGEPAGGAGDDAAAKRPRNRRHKRRRHH
jgi:hypothetical protein